MKKNNFQLVIITCMLLGLMLTSCSKNENIFDEQTIEDKLKSTATVVDVFCGSTCAFALKSDGTLWGTGGNSLGQLGTGDNTNRSNFVQVLTNVKSVGAGRFHTLVLKNDGTVWATGFNSRGQLGTGDITNRYSFVQVASNAKAVASGNLHNPCAY